MAPAHMYELEICNLCLSLISELRRSSTDCTEIPKFLLEAELAKPSKDNKTNLL